MISRLPVSSTARTITRACAPRSSRLCPLDLGLEKQVGMRPSSGRERNASTCSSSPAQMHETSERDADQDSPPAGPPGESRPRTLTPAAPPLPAAAQTACGAADRWEVATLPLCIEPVGSRPNADVSQAGRLRTGFGGRPTATGRPLVCGLLNSARRTRAQFAQGGAAPRNYVRVRGILWPSHVYRYIGEAVSTARCLALALVQWPSLRRERRGVRVK